MCPDIIFFFNDPATTEIYTYCHTLSLHDALPISAHHQAAAGCEVVERRKIPHWRLPRPADQRGLGGAGPCVFNGKVRVKEKICPEETVKINIITYLISRIGPKNARQAGLRG